MADSIRADPILYGELVLQYLGWCVHLLDEMERASTSRPRCSAAVDHLVLCAEAYSAAPDRWPVVSELVDPARRLIAAHYAVRATQKVNALVRPAIIRVDYAEPQEFVVEVLGQKACEVVGQHKNADLARLSRAEEELDVEPEACRVFLSSAQRRRLAVARTPAPAPPPPAPAVDAPPPVVAPAEQDLELSWIARLVGTYVILEQSNASDYDYSGSSYSSSESFLFLYEGHRYRLKERSFSRISYSGLTIGGPSENVTEGDWFVEVRRDQPILVLRGDDGGLRSHALNEGGANTLILDGRPRSWVEF